MVYKELFTQAKILSLGLKLGPKNRLKRMVGNRVVKSLRSDSFKSSFSRIYSTVNTPTKKRSQHKTPCYLPVLRYGPSMSKFWGKR